MEALETVRETVSHLSLRQALSLPILTGLATSLVYRKYEVTPEQPLATITLLLLNPLLSAAGLISHFAFERAVGATFVIFYAALTASTIAYRVSPWHPLSKYPGPFLAKVSQLWFAKQTTTGQWSHILKDLHEIYGPYVRIGPNQLSFVDASLIPVIMGQGGMPKGPMFDGARIPGVPSNVVATRDLVDHTQKRKPWAKGLSVASVKEYTPTIIRRALELAEELDKHAFNLRVKNGDTTLQQSVNLASWMSRFAFDFMGDMAFGGGFELMKEGDVTGIWGMIELQLQGQALLQRLPWAASIAHKLPFVVSGMAKFTKFVDACVTTRRTRGPREKDLFFHLVDEDRGPSGYPDHKLVIENSKVAIVAGSDTTATTLANMFFNIMTNADVMHRLRSELDEAFPPGEGDPFDLAKLSDLPILNACINETLRLQPPVPTDLQRAPAGGKGSRQIGDHILPEGTAVNIPPYVIQRQPRYFSPMPDTFWIDRWLQTSSNPAVISLSSPKAPLVETHDLTAFIPFSYGPANCAGKMLALAEIRAVAALLLQRFDFAFPKEYNTARWEKEMNNYFVLRLSELPVVMTRRF